MPYHRPRITNVLLYIKIVDIFLENSNTKIHTEMDQLINIIYIILFALHQRPVAYLKLISRCGDYLIKCSQK